MEYILHFLFKNDKIADQIIENFTDSVSGNIFLIFDNTINKEEEVKFDYNIVVFDYLNDDINVVINKYNSKLIFLHSLKFEFAHTILKITNPIKIGWFVWGFEIYSLPKIRHRLYAPLTKKFLNKKDWKFSIQNLIRQNASLRGIYYRYFLNKKDDYLLYSQARSKVNYFISYIREDYDYFSKFYKNNLIFEYAPFSTIDQYLAGLINLTIVNNNNNNNILVGNSNTAESNYLDVISYLNKYSTVFNKAYFVLSYGIDNLHKSVVQKNGLEILGNKFIPILEFSKRDDYIKLISSCGTAIFYHYRQQGMGNIIAMLYLGARVYLSAKNPVYDYLKRIGIVIFDLKEDFIKFGTTPLSIEDSQNNKIILTSNFNHNKLKKDYKLLVQNLTNH